MLTVLQKCTTINPGILRTIDIYMYCWTPGILPVPMSLEGISKRVEMSLALTAANEIVAYITKLPDIDTWTMAKMAVVFTVWLVYADTVWTQLTTDSNNVDREGIVKILGITRQISILAVARILLSLVQGPIPSLIQTSLYEEMLPLTSWPLLEAMFKMSLVVVVMALALQVSAYSSLLRRFSPEIERIMYSLQFLFADTITPLIVDYKFKRMIALVGVLLLKYITDNMQGA
jgi:hypothetical protein